MNATPEHPTIDERLRQLEEAEAFGQRTIEQLEQELAAVGRRLEETSRRVELLERRLGQMAQSELIEGPEAEPPT